MIGRHLWVFNVLILGVFSYLLADLVSLFIGRNLQVNPALPPAAELALQPAQVRPPADLAAAILQRNIFSTQPVAMIEPEPMAAPPPPPPPLLPLRLRLIGTVVEPDGQSFAIVEDIGTREQNLYRVGDPIGDDATLAEINRNQVAITRGPGRKLREIFEVMLEEPGPGTSEGFAVPPQPPPVARALPEAPTGSNARVLDKREVQEALENLPQLLTKARVVPFMTPEGKNDGFRIVSIAPNSFYDRIGLRNGDVLQRINGIEIRDPETFMRVFSQLKDESNISLDLVRRNQKESLTYEIR